MKKIYKQPPIKYIFLFLLKEGEAMFTRGNKVHTVRFLFYYFEVFVSTRNSPAFGNSLFGL